MVTLYETYVHIPVANVLSAFEAAKAKELADIEKPEISIQLEKKGKKNIKKTDSFETASEFLKKTKCGYNLLEACVNLKEFSDVPLGKLNCTVLLHDEGDGKYAVRENMNHEYAPECKTNCGLGKVCKAFYKALTDGQERTFRLR
jgi:hypothetical protein